MTFLPGSCCLGEGEHSDLMGVYMQDRHKFILNNFIKNAMRGGRLHGKILEELRSHDAFSLAQLREYQQKKLLDIIQYAYSHCRYYQTSFKKAGVLPGDIKSIDDLPKLPILTKKDVRENHDALFSDRKGMLGHKEYTSGTTGTPLMVFRDMYSIHFENAAISRTYQWAGYRKKDRIAYIRGQDFNIDYYDMFHGILFINASTLSTRLEEAVQLLNKYHIDYIYSLSSTAEMLANHIMENKKDIIQLKGIVTSSELLSPFVREKVRQAFRCNIYDYYGNTERVSMISNCSEGEYHLMLDYGAEYLKPVDQNRFEIISTNLFNYAMPFINYATGDIIEMDGRPSLCGMHYPVVKSIIGRDSNYVLLNGLKIYSTTLTNVFSGIEDFNIIRSQFVQNHPEELILNVHLENENDLKSIQIIQKNFIKWFSYEKLEVRINGTFITGPNKKVPFIIKEMEGGHETQ